jgi:hypothetical protein
MSRLFSCEKHRPIDRLHNTDKDKDKDTDTDTDIDK